MERGVDMGVNGRGSLDEAVRLGVINERLGVVLRGNVLQKRIGVHLVYKILTGF